MEQKFGTNKIDLQVLRDFCEREGRMVEYQKGEQMEREGEPSRWFGFVTKGCFKYTVRSISDKLQVGDHRSGIGIEHFTWLSFEGEFVGDYPSCLNGSPSLTTIEATLPTRVLQVSGEQLIALFSQDMEMMGLRSIIAEHLLRQARERYLDFHRATARERYELLLNRCPGIVEHLPLNAISSFLCITPQTLSKIRKDITFEDRQ